MVVRVGGGVREMKEGRERCMEIRGEDKVGKVRIG